MNIDYEIFSVRLEETLKKRKISKSKLADTIGCTRQTIYLYCEGKAYPSIYNLICISKVLDVSSDYLLGLSDAGSDIENTKSIKNLFGLSEQSIKKIESWAYHRKNEKKDHRKQFDNIDALNLLMTGKYSDTLFGSIAKLMSQTAKTLPYIEKGNTKTDVGAMPPMNYPEMNISVQKAEIHYNIWKCTSQLDYLLKENIVSYVKGDEYETRRYGEYKY